MKRVYRVRDQIVKNLEEEVRNVGLTLDTKHLQGYALIAFREAKKAGFVRDESLIEQGTRMAMQSLRKDYRLD